MKQMTSRCFQSEDLRVILPLILTWIMGFTYV